MTGPEDAARWRPDVLGAAFQQRTLPLGADDEGDVVATLVRYRRRPRLVPRGPAAGIDVLYVHGWSDYFFQAPLAEFWRRQGARFHALDLRKYGRSLRPGQTPGYVTHLDEYDADIEAALAAIGHGVGARTRRRLLLMGHSTGGLTLSLWADRHPGRAAALVLNSPWLEFQATAIGRQLLAPFLRLDARRHPKRQLPAVDPGFYARTVLAEREGEWRTDLDWRPERGFRATGGWLQAVLDGHARVAAGLTIDVPVLVLLSKRSLLQPLWDERMRSVDVALDVDEIARAALALGDEVTVARIDGALHDVVLSPEPVRTVAYDRIRTFLAGATRR